MKKTYHSYRNVDVDINHIKTMLKKVYELDCADYFLCANNLSEMKKSITCGQFIEEWEQLSREYILQLAFNEYFADQGLTLSITRGAKYEYRYHLAKNGKSLLIEELDKGVLYVLFKGLCILQDKLDLKELLAIIDLKELLAIIDENEDDRLLKYYNTILSLLKNKASIP